MRKNNINSKNCENLSNKMLHTNRKQFSVVRAVDGYRGGRKIHRAGKCVKLWQVNVLNSDFNDLEGVGFEQLVLWKMTTKDMEELRQQIKQEALHKKRENIMPLTMQMSKEQIENAYHSITKQWNDTDGDTERQMPRVVHREQLVTHERSELEENNNAEDADERNMARSSSFGSGCKILDDYGVESVDEVFETERDDFLFPKEQQHSEFSSDTLTFCSNEDDNRESPTSSESTVEYQTPCQDDLRKEMNVEDQLCLDNSAFVQKEHEHLPSNIKQQEIRNSENERQHCVISVSDASDETTEMLLTDANNHVTDSTAGVMLLHQKVNLSENSVQKQKRGKLGVDDLCCLNENSLIENKDPDNCIHRGLITESDVIAEQQNSTEIINKQDQQRSNAGSDCGVFILKNGAIDGNCDRLKIHGVSGTYEPFKRLSVDLCRSVNYLQPCFEKRRKRRKTDTSPCSSYSKCRLVENHNQKQTFSKDSAKDFCVSTVNKSKPLLSLKNEAKSNQEIFDQNSVVKAKKSYTKLFTGEEPCDVNDSCLLRDLCENTDPIEREHLNSDMKNTTDEIVNEVVPTDSALEPSKVNSSIQLGFNGDSSQDTETEKSPTRKPVSKPGHCQKIQLCEVDLFSQEKRKLSSSTPFKCDEFKQQTNHEHMRQKKTELNHVLPLKKLTGQKSVTANVDSVQNQTKDFRKEIKKSIADDIKRSEKDREFSSNLESSLHHVENTNLPTDSNITQGKIKTFHYDNSDIPVTEPNSDIGSEFNHRSISNICADKPNVHETWVEESKRLSSQIELDIKLGKLSSDGNETKLCNENPNRTVTSKNKYQAKKVSESGNTLVSGLKSINSEHHIPSNPQDDSIIQTEKLDFPRHLYTGCSDTAEMMAKTMPTEGEIPSIQNMYSEQCCEANMTNVFFPNNECDDSVQLETVFCINSKDGREIANSIADPCLENESSSTETSSANVPSQTICAPEDSSFKKDVMVEKPYQAHCSDISELKNNVPCIINDSCKSNSCCHTLKTDFLPDENSGSIILNSNDSCGNSPSVVRDHDENRCNSGIISPIHSPSVIRDHDENRCNSGIISPIHSPSPYSSCSSTSLYDYSGIHEVYKCDQQNPVIIPLSVADQATCTVLECLRTIKIHMLAESDEGYSNAC